MPLTPMSPGFYDAFAVQRTFLDFGANASLSDIAEELSSHIDHIIQAPYTFEQLRTASIGHLLQPLQSALSSHRHESIVTALLILKHKYSTGQHQNQGIDRSRGFACEILAWRFLNGLSDDERMEALLMEIPVDESERDRHALDTEDSPLLEHSPANGSANEDTAASTAFPGLNALEIAVVAGAKQFLSQSAAQGIVDSLWAGKIMFWTSLDVNTHKRPRRDHQ